MEIHWLFGVGNIQQPSLLAELENLDCHGPQAISTHTLHTINAIKFCNQWWREWREVGSANCGCRWFILYVGLWVNDSLARFWKCQLWLWAAHFPLSLVINGQVSLGEHFPMDDQRRWRSCGQSSLWWSMGEQSLSETLDMIKIYIFSLSEKGKNFSGSHGLQIGNHYFRGSQATLV